MPANYQYIADLTVPDDMQITAGSTFIKTWRVKNTGDVAWDNNFTLRFEKGVAMTPKTTQPLPACAPGEEVDISLSLTAPTEQGTHFGDWWFYDAAGNRFGQIIYLRLVATPQVTPILDGAFVADITIPDDTVVPTGKVFTKVWRVRNNGNIPWEPGFKFVHTNGEAMTGITSISLPQTMVGATAEISIDFTAPQRVGTVFSDWRFTDPAGNQFGEIIYVRVNAQNIESANSSKPTVGVSGNDILDGTWAADVTIPDDMQMQPGEAFTKIWRVRNTGTAAWGKGFTLRFVGGLAQTNTTEVPLPEAAPGSEVLVSVDLTAPKEPGMAYGDWKFFDASGNPFGDMVYWRVQVQGGNGSSTGASSGSIASGSATTTGQSSTSGSSFTTNPALTAEKGKFDHMPIMAPAPFFSQWDSRWANTRLGSSPSITIGMWGCMMTSNAMFAAYKGKDIDPGRLNSLMIQKSVFWQGYFTPFDTASRVYPDIQFMEHVDKPAAGTVTKINQWLAEKVPVLVNVDQNPKTAYNSNNEQHWVVIVGKNGDDDYLINDPAEKTEGVISLMEKYGYQGRPVWEAIQQAVFYR